MSIIKIDEYIMSDYICLNLIHNNTFLNEDNIIYAKINYVHVYIYPIMCIAILFHFLFFCIIITFVYKKKYNNNNNNSDVV